MKLINSLSDIAVLVGIFVAAAALFWKLFSKKIARQIIRGNVPLSVLDALHQHSGLYVTPWNIRKTLDEGRLHKNLSTGGIVSVLNLLISHGLCNKKKILGGHYAYTINKEPAEIILRRPRSIPQIRRDRPASVQESSRSPPPTQNIPNDESAHPVVRALLSRPNRGALSSAMTFAQLQRSTRMDEKILRAEIQRLALKKVIERGVVQDDGRASEGFQLSWEHESGSPLPN